MIFAQQKVDPMKRAAKQADKMKTELSLDEVQYQAVKAINEEYADKRSQVWRDTTLSKEAKHEQTRILHQEKDAALKKVLTEEQHKKFAANQSVQSGKPRGRAAKHRGDHAIRMQKSLSLTEEQTSKIKAIDKEFSDKFRALRSDNTMAKEDVRTQAKLLREEYFSKTKSVLTEDQFKKWEEQKAERPKKRF